jgi:dTDP-4-dehydrorhamnose 3,5-epimerase
MIFTETKLKGAYIIEPERLSDERGFFARTWCQKEFQIQGLNKNVVQCNISYNKRPWEDATQEPHEEAD